MVEKEYKNNKKNKKKKMGACMSIVLNWDIIVFGNISYENCGVCTLLRVKDVSDESL